MVLSGLILLMLTPYVQKPRVLFLEVKFHTISAKNADMRNAWGSLGGDYEDDVLATAVII
jgi:hypothetical protein